MYPWLSNCYWNPLETILRAVVTCPRSTYENLISIFYNAGSSCYLDNCAVWSLWVCLTACWPWGMTPCHQLCLALQMCRRTCCAWADGENSWSLGAFPAPFGADGTRVSAPGALHGSLTLGREGGRRAIQDNPYLPQLLLPLFFCKTFFWAGGSVPPLANACLALPTLLMKMWQQLVLCVVWVGFPVTVWGWAGCMVLVLSHVALNAIMTEVKGSTGKAAQVGLSLCGLHWRLFVGALR